MICRRQPKDQGSKSRGLKEAVSDLLLWAFGSGACRWVSRRWANRLGAGQYHRFGLDSLGSIAAKTVTLPSGPSLRTRGVQPWLGSLWWEYSSTKTSLPRTAIPVGDHG